MSPGRRRACSLAAELKNLSLPETPARKVTILSLGETSARVSLADELPPESTLALDFHLPGYPREVCGILKPTETQDHEHELRFVHLPLFERNVIRNWVAGGDPPSVAAAIA